MGDILVGPEGYELQPGDSPGQGINEEDDQHPDAGVELPAVATLAAQLGIALRLNPAAAAPPVLDPTLSTTILAAQLEHALKLQDDIQAGLAVPNSSHAHRRLSLLEREVALLTGQLCAELTLRGSRG